MSPEAVDFVVPAHNSAELLPETVAEISRWAMNRDVTCRVLIVENGSRDDTLAVAEKLAAEYAEGRCVVVAATSDVGMGNAYRAGIALTKAKLVVLTADDLPFGTSDVDHWWGHPVEGLAIGSKAHAESAVHRGASRSIASLGFRVLRRVLLGSRVGDPQGTLLAPGPWLRSLEPSLEETGYLSSTEIVLAAEAMRLPITEMPVTLTTRQQAHATRIKLSDVWQMGVGLVTLRRRSRRFSDAIPQR